MVVAIVCCRYAIYHPCVCGLHLGRSMCAGCLYKRQKISIVCESKSYGEGDFGCCSIAGVWIFPNHLAICNIRSPDMLPWLRNTIRRCLLTASLIWRIVLLVIFSFKLMPITSMPILSSDTVAVPIFGATKVSELRLCPSVNVYFKFYLLYTHL